MGSAGESRRAKQAREKKVRETNEDALKVSPILEVLCEASVHSTLDSPMGGRQHHTCFMLPLILPPRSISSSP